MSMMFECSKCHDKVMVTCPNNSGVDSILMKHHCDSTEPGAPEFRRIF